MFMAGVGRMIQCAWVDEAVRPLECRCSDNLKDGHFVNHTVCMLCLMGQIVENGPSGG